MRPYPKNHSVGVLKIFAVTLFLGIFTLGLAQLIENYSDPRLRGLKQRADRIFAYDRQIQKLSFNRLAALSMALEFRDYNGAEALIASFEREMKPAAGSKL
jgi:hypothetical protein